MHRYHSYSAYLKRRFGVPVLKIPVNGGFTCPNRDGTLSSAGCTFCDNQAFSPAVFSTATPLTQLTCAMKAAPRRFKAFIAYLQPFTNTYGSVDRLAAVYEPLIRIPDVVGLAIGTRPDCLGEGVREYLADLAKRTFLTVELGLQSSNDATLAEINRGHGFESFVDAARGLSARGIETVAHMMIGLPGEDAGMIYQTADRLAALPVAGVKFHQLMVIRGTGMEALHASGRLSALTLEAYAPLLSGCIERLRPEQMVHRIMADTRMEHGLIAPLWSADKKGSLRFLHDYMDRHNVEQGGVSKVRNRRRPGASFSS
ncbi:MAG: TIGR01212 family radical SAM protein [Chitinispirillaceae bacterium]|nr:TIGR01212 family radical SAM protein [Chitinispirillaceae bacterium]